MKDFPIKFSFAAVDYIARVVAYSQNTQFHVSGFLPKINGMELPYVIHKKRSGGFSWLASKAVPQELGQVIFDAIQKSQKL